MEQYQRIELLIGKEGFAKLREACIMVVGCGGVGSYAVEALARSGVGKIVVVDKDVVSLSNLNRQIMATYETVGKEKTLMMKQRVESYADCEIICINKFFDDTCNDLLDGVDFVVDAIDTMTSKLALIKMCHEKKVPFVVCLGMANRLDPSMIEYTRLDKTSYDPVAKIMRQLVKKERMNYRIPVIFSREIPIKQNVEIDENGKTMKDRIPPASMIFVPAAAGLLAASVAMRCLLDKLQ